MNEHGVPLTAASRVEGLEPGSLDGDFEAFFRAERTRLLGSLLVLTGSTFDAEEILQESFFKVWERWDRVGAMEDPSGYLYRTALNTHRSAYRRAVRAAKRVFAPPPVDDPFTVVAAREGLLRALAAMTPRQRAVIVLTELQGYDVDETARTLGIKPTTVRVLVSRARATIRDTERTDG